MNLKKKIKLENNTKGISEITKKMCELYINNREILV